MVLYTNVITCGTYCEREIILLKLIELLSYVVMTWSKCKRERWRYTLRVIHEVR